MIWADPNQGWLESFPGCVVHVEYELCQHGMLWMTRGVRMAGKTVMMTVEDWPGTCSCVNMAREATGDGETYEQLQLI